MFTIQIEKPNLVHTVKHFCIVIFFSLFWRHLQLILFPQLVRDLLCTPSMKKLIGMFIIGTLLTGCGYPMGMIAGESKSSSIASDWNTASVDPALEAKALKVLQNNCTTCHGNGAGSGGVHSLTNVNHLISSGLVVPKNPNASKIFTVVKAGSMPPGKPLAAADVEALRAWIAGSGSSAGGATPPSTTNPSPSPSPTASPAPTVTPPSNAAEVAAFAILQTNCAGCHGAAPGLAGVYGLNDRNHMVSSGLVVPGNPNGSRLFNVIAAGRMPTTGALSSADQDKIRVWIAGLPTSTTPSPTPTPSPTVTPTPTPSPSPTVPPAPGDAAALNILQVNCAGCHAATAGPANVYNVANKAHLISSGLIKPGDPFNSRIFIAIQAGTMPKAGPLSAADQEIVKQFIIAAGGGTPTTPPPPPAVPEPKFTYLKNHIIGPKCASCHYTGSAKGGYAFDTYAGVLRAVKTSRPTDSDLYKEAQKGDMPPRPNQQLSSSELNLILQWIQAGAKND